MPASLKATSVATTSPIASIGLMTQVAIKTPTVSEAAA
jgi:hypothetical protein